MSSAVPRKSASSTFVRLSDRALYGVVRRLVRISEVLAPRRHFDAPSSSDSTSRETALRVLVGQLTDRGFLELPDEVSATSPRIRLVAMGSSVNVALIGDSHSVESLILKFTDSSVASAELAASSDIQERLAADPRLSSWSSYIPHVRARGRIGATTFAIEQCLSARDGRAVSGDRAATNALIARALSVIGEFHRVGSRRGHIDAEVLNVVVDRPIEILRDNTPAGVFHARARSIERLATWLRRSLLGLDFEVGWTHGDFHLGNVLIDDGDGNVVGIVDWGRAQPDELAVLDGFTLIVVERAKIADVEMSPFLLELLSDLGRASGDSVRADVLDELRSLVDHDPKVDLRCLLMLTWLKHVSNNLKNEDRSRSHALWRLRTIDLVLFGAAAIIGY